MKLTKRFLSLLLAVVMVLSMIPAVYAADEAEATAPTRGAALGASKTYEADKWIEVETDAQLKAAMSNNAGASHPDNADLVVGIRLMNDITLTSESFTKSSGTLLYFGYYKDATDTAPSQSRPQTVVVDLGGHTLTADSTVKASHLFGAYGGSTVTFTNGTIIQDGTYTGYAPAMFYNGGVKFTVDGVEWIMRDESDRANYGGFFNLSSSSQSLTVINSTITKEGGTVYRGGIVNTAGACTITLKNSVFNGGHAVGKDTDYFARGGQFYVADKANMTAENCAFIGGQVSGTTSYTQGGNICKYGDEGKVTLTGCTVSDGTAKQGGNIATIASGRVILNDTTVTGGTSTAEGGSIYLNTGSLTLNGDTFITGGQAYNKGGNIYVTAGTVNINDNTIIEKGVIANEGNVLTYGGNICVDGTTEEKATTLNMNGGIIRDGNVSSSSTASSTYIGGGNIAGFYSVTINLNGGQILNGKAKNNDTTNGLAMGANIYVGSSSVLNIYDGVTVSGGFADSAKNNQNRGGNIGYTGSTVNIYGGLIENGKADRAGNLFAPSTSAKLNIYGGVIKDGKATNSYGGNMSCNGAVKIYGGQIQGGSAYTTYGDSVYMADNTSAVLHVYGGIIDSTVNNAVYKGSSSKATIQLYSVVLGDEPNAAYIAECSTISNVDGMFHVIHNDVEGATTVVEATCTIAGSKTIECATCKQTYTYEIPAAGHTPKAPVVENEVANSCTADGSYDTVVYCEDCNAELSRETTTVPAAGHTEVTDAAVAPTCTATGLTEGKHCSVCGTVTVDQEEVPALGHAWDEGVIDPKPTCNDAGVKTYTCATCGETKTEAVEATGHTEVTDAAVAPDCVNTGLTEGKHCSVCGTVTVAQEEVPALGHTEETIAGKAATCTETGLTEGKKCTVCGVVTVEQNEIPALGHTEVIDQAVAATCTATGMTEGKHCSVCGTVTVAQQEVPALGHSYTGVKTEATFENDAFTTYTCGTCGDSYTETEEGTQLRVPTADVGKLEALTLKAGEYGIYTGSLVESTEDLPLEVVVKLAATETEAGSMADWLVDFNLTFTGMANGSITADNCYLAGNYGEFGWIAIPTDGMVLEDGVTYPVVAVAGIHLNYNDIVTSVKEFIAAIHIDQAILDANPNLAVNLELVMTDPEDADNKIQVGEDMIYTAEDLKNEEKIPPAATVTEQEAMILESGEYLTWPNGATNVDRPLEIVVNFQAEDTLEECLAGGYAEWLVDFNLTVSGMENDSIIADNCYLAGNYGEFGWIVIPTDGMELKNGVTYPVVSGYDATLNYKDICKSVQNFTAAIHIDQAILDANPNLEVKLELVMTNPQNADDKMQVGEDIIYTAEKLTNNLKKPEALVTPMGKVTLTEDEYRVWNGMVREPGITEDKALVAGKGEMPLEVVVNFKAIDTLEECLAGGYEKWLVDFNITVEGLANGSFVADNCYLAGNYGSYGWIKIPLDGRTIEQGVAYPVVALYDPTLNYKDICKSVKDFTAAIHIDQAILDANPSLTVKLELVMTNPNNASDTLQIGEDLIYGFEALSSGVAAQNKNTGMIYATIEAAMEAAQAEHTIILLANHAEEEVAVKRDKTLDLNGFTLTASVVTSSYASSGIIDSTDGKGLLVIERDKLAIHNGNANLPVWMDNDGGYRFVKVELRQNAKLDENGNGYFRFYIVGNDAKCALQQALADGGADNGVSVRVTLEWKDLNGNEASKTFIYKEEQLIKYAANWTGNEFRLTVTGMEKVSELSLTAALVSEANASTNVTISGDTKSITK